MPLAFIEIYTEKSTKHSFASFFSFYTLLRILKKNQHKILKFGL